MDFFTGQMVMDGIEFWRAEAQELLAKANKADAAWQAHDYQTLHDMGLLSKRKLEELQAKRAAQPSDRDWETVHC